METLFLIIKGFFMGVANVIPGVSGGTIALILGIYEKFIGSISNIFKDLKGNLRFLIPIAVGMGISIITMSKVVGYSYDNFPLPTLLFFVGLVFGGIPMLLSNVKGKKESKQLSSYIIAIMAFLVVIFMSCYKFIFNIGGEVSFGSMSFVSYVLLFVVGIVAAATMVIPGISGSLVLMILGYYYPVINTINALFKEDFMHNAIILCVFGMGVVIGILLISKLLEILFKRYSTKTYFGVLGFVFASILAIPLSACIELGNISVSIEQSMVGLVLLVLGFFVSYKLGEK